MIIKFLQLTLVTAAFSLCAYPQASPAIIAITNAKVHTVDNESPQAEALAIKDNKIVAVGTNEEIQKLIGSETKVIDAKGKLVLPGFNDSHVHFTGIGNQFSSLDLRFVTTTEEISKKLSHYVRFIPKRRWILGGQWNHRNWKPRRLPTKNLIDAVTPNNPVFLYSHDAKMAWANSSALKIAGIDKNSSNPGGGEIVRDENGEPTGLLKGSAMLLVKFKAPKTQTKDWLPVTETATNYAASLGVTSVQDVHSDYQIDVLLELEKEGKLKTRVYDCTPLHEWEKLKKMMDEKPLKSSLVRIGCLKSFSDGFEESIPQLYENINAADRAGLQVMMHAIGNNANEIVLGIFERIENENTKRDRRYRIEHAFRFRFENLGRFSKSNIIVSLQPYLFGGNEPYRSFINNDTKIAFGSDASITDFNPLFSIHAAVNRGSFEGGVRQSVTVEEAVRFYTMGSAYAEFQDEVKGSITAGKLADVIILSEDIFSIAQEQIRETKVIMTIVDGKVVYEAAGQL